MTIVAMATSAGSRMRHAEAVIATCCHGNRHSRHVVECRLPFAKTGAKMGFDGKHLVLGDEISR